MSARRRINPHCIPAIDAGCRQHLNVMIVGVCLGGCTVPARPAGSPSMRPCQGGSTTSRGPYFSTALPGHTTMGCCWKVVPTWISVGQGVLGGPVADATPSMGPWPPPARCAIISANRCRLLYSIHIDRLYFLVHTHTYELNDNLS